MTPTAALQHPSLPARERLAAARVLVVGDAMLDRYWYRAVERISPEAPAPVVRVQRVEERIGAAGNVGCNIVALGAQASLLAVVGDDEPGRRLEQLVAATGIAPHFGRDAAVRTTVKLRVIGRQQQLLRMDFETLPEQATLSSQSTLFARLLPCHDVVLFSDYAKGGLGHVGHMIGAAREAGKAVLVDPKGSDDNRYRGATLITPNRTELQQVVGSWRDEAELREKAQRLRCALQLQALLLTRSEQGMTLYDADGELHASTQAREVFDVTGAGDTVIATMVALLAAGCQLSEAVPLADKAGAIVVGKFGTATASYDELSATP